MNFLISKHTSFVSDSNWFKLNISNFETIGRTSLDSFNSSNFTSTFTFLTINTYAMFDTLLCSYHQSKVVFATYLFILYHVTSVLSTLHPILVCITKDEKSTWKRMIQLYSPSTNPNQVFFTNCKNLPDYSQIVPLNINRMMYALKVLFDRYQAENGIIY